MLTCVRDIIYVSKDKGNVFIDITHSLYCAFQMLAEKPRFYADIAL
jgi:hypothetical protein